MSVTPYVTIPLAVFQARQEGVITGEMLQILQFAYWAADRSNGFCVAAYSAERVCSFNGVPPTEANLQRYRRAGVSLLKLNVIKRDYYRLDPLRSQKTERTYSIWVPAPSRFERIGSPEENFAALWQQRPSLSIRTADVSLKQPDNVTLPMFVSDTAMDTYAREQTDNQPDKQPDNCHSLSATPKIERETPCPLEGVPPLPSPPGMRSTAAGLRSSAAGLKSVHRKPLNPKQCETLNDIATEFKLCFATRFSFHPDDDCPVYDLLWDFSPLEIQLAYLVLYEGSTRANSTKAFFLRAAKEWIVKYRQDYPHETDRIWIVVPETGYAKPEGVTRDGGTFDAVQEKWCALFGYQPVSIRLWVDKNKQWHFYHPELEACLFHWKSELERRAMPAGSPPCKTGFFCKSCGIPVPERRLYCGGLGCENPQRPNGLREQHVEVSLGTTEG